MTTVKYLHSGMGGAPVLSNGWGELITLLDACLVTGFNLKTITGITFAGGFATATISGGHTYQADQIVNVAGCDQAAYNGDQRLSAVTPTSITYPVVGTPTTPATASGAISCKLAPLGWEKAFSGANKAAYRSLNVQSNRPYLRVDNSLDPVWTTTYAKFAKVTMAQSMTDIDTFTGARAPFDGALPTVNEVGTGAGSTAVNGWMKWYHARTSGNSGDTTDGGAGARAWVLVGDNRGFYLHVSHGVGMPHGLSGYTFTDFESFTTGDAFNTLLCANERKAQPANTGNPSTPDEFGKFAFSNDFVGKYLMRDWSGLVGPVRAGFLSLNYGNNQQVSGITGSVPFPNGPDYSLVLHPVYLREEQRGDLRGVMPGYFHTPQALSYPNLSILDNVVGYPGRKFVMIEGGHDASTTLRSRYFYDITGPWR